MLQCLRVLSGAGGVAPAPHFQWCVRWAGLCRARGGCRAGLSVPGDVLGEYKVLGLNPTLKRDEH